MKNKKYLEINRYDGSVLNFNLQEVLDEEGITKEVFFGNFEKRVTKDYTSYDGEEAIYIELPA